MWPVTERLGSSDITVTEACSVTGVTGEADP